MRIELIGAYRSALQVSLLALPVQNYKYCADKYSIYWLCWYKRTKTDAAAVGAGVACYAAGGELCEFTCFTGTKVQILTLQLVAQALPAMLLAATSLRPTIRRSGP